MYKRNHWQALFLIIICSFVSASFLFISNNHVVPAFSVSEANKALYKGNENIALTFNIGWGDVRAEQILKTLDELGVKNATFFLSGSWAEAHPLLVEKIVKEGYEIGILGYNYVDYSDVETKVIRQDINKAITAFDKLNIKKIKYLRAPTGDFDERLITVAKNYGYTVVHWSINPHDWKNPGTEKIVKEVMKSEDGDIVLLHASDSATQTANSLPSIINGLQNKGLKLVTISEMFSNAKQTTTEVE